MSQRSHTRNNLTHQTKGIKPKEKRKNMWKERRCSYNHEELECTEIKTLLPKHKNYNNCFWRSPNNYKS
jgi:phage-related protein